MAEGNFDVAPRVFADDEVGQLADSFGETRSNLRRLLGRVGGSGSTITDGVRVITGGTEMLLVRSQDQTDLTQSSSMAWRTCAAASAACSARPTRSPS